MTLRELIISRSDILRKADIVSANLDARVLIKHVLNFDDIDLIKKSDEVVSTDKIVEIDKLIFRRTQNEPIAYITGHKEFYGLDFLVSSDVLIPRPESEWLVERAIESIGSFRSAEISGKIIRSKVCKESQNDKINIIDIGTGSGCIIISLVKSLYRLSTLQTLQTFDFSASDISPDALKVAEKNAKLHEINNINFFESDLFNNIDSKLKFDLITANLPYVPCHCAVPTVAERRRDEEQRSKPTASLRGVVATWQSLMMDCHASARNDISFEPTIAIFASDNGAEIIKRFLTQSEHHLTSTGQILLELDPRNALEICDYATKIFPQKNINLEKDLANFDRYLIID